MMPKTEVMQAKVVHQKLRWQIRKKNRYFGSPTKQYKMSLSTSHQLVRNKLEQLTTGDEKAAKRTIVVFELPFMIEEDDISEFFEKAVGNVKKVMILRSSALVFSSAVIEFASKKQVDTAIKLALQGLCFADEFDIILQSAVDFFEGKKPIKPETKATTATPLDTPHHEHIQKVKKEKCKVQ